ncbi:nuclear transport factor 2 family protein [Azoarcus sp. L1K30]|uniref:YybH family protein n=1 Tax=Azoarcus sp. L1K30 TaxID=2820277 RepID=UPI001B82C0B6|nr:nuclear transport factor 2 family protein [Azoarcus sp. L1K30]MBR0568528.1 nuclear transport factor 2 family protein [Azoarcus sp. L1K30]
MSDTVFTTPADAEAAFYDALARADLETMMSVWSADDEVVCVHPNGPRIVGLAAVRELWRQIFASGMRLSVRTSHTVVSETLVLAVHNVLEEVAEAGSEPAGPPIVATNVYARGGNGWRMVMHHASPTPNLMDIQVQGTPRVVH